MLALAQQDLLPDLPRVEYDDWSEWFRDHPIHQLVADLTTTREST